MVRNYDAMIALNEAWENGEIGEKNYKEAKACEQKYLDTGSYD